MHPHLADEQLSAIIDGQLAAGELTDAQAHLSGCADCQHRLDEMRSVVSMLRGLPTLEPPRSFVLGPRPVADPPNVVRLRRWYTATRIAAGSLAAGFVLLSASALYVDTRSTPVTASRGTVALQAPPAGEAAGARESSKAAAPAQAPAAARAPVATVPPPSQLAAPAAAGASRSQAPHAADPPEGADQVAATTSVRPLPTPLPTPTLAVATRVAAAAPTSVAPQPADDAARLRVGAVVVGLLTVLALFAAVLARHRLQHIESRP